MADPLSTVASGIAIVQVAGKVATTCQALYGLWQDVKDIPENIDRLLKSIKLVTTVLAKIERNSCSVPPDVEEDQLMRDILGFAREAVTELQMLVEELSRDIHAAKRTTKLAARIKVVLKQSKLSKHEARLRNAFSLLTLAQQSYTNAQQLQMMQVVPDLGSLSRSSACLPSCQANITANPGQNRCTTTNDGI
jgi:hypothetical protein